nr:DUF1433 domain-containing protein [Listeria rustica]
MQTKIILASIGILLLFSITGGVLFVKHEINKREEAREEADNKLIAEEKPRIEKYLKYNYENIDSVTVTEVVHNPTGIPHIMGYVNGDKKLSFDAGVYDERFEGALDATGDSFPYTKDLNHNMVSVSEIEKREQEKQE